MRRYLVVSLVVGQLLMLGEAAAQAGVPPVGFVHLSYGMRGYSPSADRKASGSILINPLNGWSSSMEK